jgi:hypothetical protein
MAKRIQSRVYRKIYEDFHGVKIPKGYHIHHIDGDRSNNHPQNLKMLTPEEHYEIHLQQSDSVAYRGKFIQGAGCAGKIGGAVRSERKLKACSENLKRGRRADLGAQASVESRRKSKTFFFSDEYQKSLQSKMKDEEIGPYSQSHRKAMREMGKSKGKRPLFENKIWNSSYEASIDTGLPASTIRYRCRNNTLGWRYEDE